MRPAVWAPRPRHVELVTGRGSLPMDRGEEGWWESKVDLEPGTDYGFTLDGGPTRPDPRSRHQPNGSDGLSRLVPASGRRGVGDWDGLDLETSVLYEMHVGTFTPGADFDSAIERLDHLVDLGVDAVELMPVNQFPGRHGWGYDGVGLYAVHDRYGGPDGLLRFVDACHRRRLGVILDVVYNHLGPSGNHLAEFGPYFTDTYRTPWGDAVNLDGPGSDEVRRFFIDNALMWLDEYGVDGLRIDAVHALFDRSAIHFLEELSMAVDRLEGETGRRLWLIAESDLNDPRLLWSRQRGGYELEASWSDDFHHSLHALLTGERDGYYMDYGSIDDLATALRSVYVYAGRYSPSRGRRHGRPVAGLPGSRFVGYIQNHDQVGNRASGERIGHLVEPALLYVAAGLVLTAPFVPMLFQGEEWAASSPFPYFSDHHQPELAEAVRRGRREEFAAFGWGPEEIPDPQDEATYRSALLRWEELDQPPHRDLLVWYKALIRLRRETADLGRALPESVSVRTDPGSSTLVMRRGAIVVAVNLSPQRQAVEVEGRPVQLPAQCISIMELLS